MLILFDLFWNTIDQQFACFNNTTIDWDSVYNVINSELTSSEVSQGRFSALLQYAAMSLRESHTNIFDIGVSGYFHPGYGTPILMTGAWGMHDEFGAGLTPLEDSSLVVYRVIDNHPLGLEPGDIVLGYNNVAWKDLYPKFLNMKMPVIGRWGSSESSFTHSMLNAAGNNWHLFDTIDVVKYSTGDTLHLSTLPMIYLNQTLFLTEQVAIPGITLPTSFDENLAWCVIENTNIGYLIQNRWGLGSYNPFRYAIDSLINIYKVDGLIVDFRTNFGGNMFYAYPGLRLLFKDTTRIIHFSRRDNPDDRYQMFMEWGPEEYQIEADSNSYFDKPIAVLTGPGAVSSGDQIALALAKHPRARVFGKSTSAAFNGPTWLESGWSDDFFFWYAYADASLVTDSGSYLTHVEFPVDEYVWHTPDMLAQGRDNVIETALDWIEYEIGVYFDADKSYGQIPLDVNFYGTSPFNVDSWQWEFGDGSTSLEQNPNHTFIDTGYYSIKVDITGENEQRSYTRENYIFAFEAILFADTVSAVSGENVEVDVNLENSLDINDFYIPVRYDGDIVLKYDSFSVSGCRTANFESVSINHFDSFNKRLSFHLVGSPDGSYNLAKGTGTVLKVYFSAQPSIIGNTTSINFDGYNNYNPQFLFNEDTVLFKCQSGVVKIGTCCKGIRGNVDNDTEDQVDISDIVYMVEYQFSDPSGPSPACLAEADVNSDDSVDIGDIVYLVEYQFSQPPGPEPMICPE